MKATLATLLLVVYGLFLHWSSKKRSCLQEDRTVMVWCLATQLVGIVLVAGITAIGTMVVYYRTAPPAIPNPFGS